MSQHTLNQQLHKTLIERLTNYIAEGIREDVLRNAHMNEYRELPFTPGTAAPSSIVFEERFANPYLTRFIKYFTDSYSGSDRMVEVCEGLVQAAKRWRKIDRLPTAFDDKAIDAMLVSFINSWAATRCLDLALYTKDIAGMATPEMAKQAETIMRKIELWTEDHTRRNTNRPDAKPAYVATVEIAPFPDAGMPQVVMWGERIFHLAAGYAQSTNEGALWVYQECFCTVSFTPSPGLPKGGETEAEENKRVAEDWSNADADGWPADEVTK